MSDDKDKPFSRREFVRKCGRFAALAGLVAGGGWLAGTAGWCRGTCEGCPQSKDCSLSAAALLGTVWQIDPQKCAQCGRCATECVLNPSAVKCVHAFKVCGYCRLCGGYFHMDVKSLTTAAEAQLCPTRALTRRFVEKPFYEYTIDEQACIGCGQCVKGCASFGNGSLYLQIRHDVCANCNDCAIARGCPVQAIRRVPRDQPYLLKEGLPTSSTWVAQSTGEAAGGRGTG